MEYFNAMEPMLRTFWFIAIPVSLIFLFQAIMSFAGADASDGLHADFDGGMDSDGPFQLFSFRNLIHFLLGFSWAGISLYENVSNPLLLILASIFIGAAFVYMFFKLMIFLHSLSEDNSFQLSQTIGKTAEVYLRIPAHTSGKGKILISIKGSVKELDAMTEGEELRQGTQVKVISIINESILLVNQLN